MEKKQIKSGTLAKQAEKRKILEREEFEEKRSVLLEKIKKAKTKKMRGIAKNQYEELIRAYVADGGNWGYDLNTDKVLEEDLARNNGNPDGGYGIGEDTTSPTGFKETNLFWLPHSAYQSGPDGFTIQVAHEFDYSDHAGVIASMAFHFQDSPMFKPYRHGESHSGKLQLIIDDFDNFCNQVLSKETAATEHFIDLVSGGIWVEVRDNYFHVVLFNEKQYAYHKIRQNLEKHVVSREPVNFFYPDGRQAEIVVYRK
ncbi:hypothetical protein FACS1894110_24660 [Spirochaetia bacterium]|nr:hypothetical protein FACS1894110_24660 [Spirochaetia bacterium]